MRLVFTMFLSLLVCSFAFAQINDESNFPADFVVDSPSSIAGIYDYGTQVADVDNAIWGEALTQTLSGELVWAFDDTDSLGCNAITTDLTGKIAFIRRGVCGFSNKCLNAQNAGAVGAVIVNHYDGADDTGATIFGMLGGETGADVTIPAVFVSRNTGEIIIGSLDNGETVNVSFKLKSFYDPISSISYQTPVSEALEIGIFGIRYANTGDDDVSVMASATITAPSGATFDLSGSRFLPTGTDSLVFMDSSYLATEMGEHTVVWSNDQNDETVESTFLMTDKTYATSIDDITLSLGPSESQFATANFIYQIGSLVAPDSDGAAVSYASFGIANAAEVFTGNADADIITVILYNGDADGDGNSNLIGADNFNGLTAVAFAEYSITGNEGADELIYVQLEDQTDGDFITNLEADGLYYLVLAYDGVSAATGIAPRFLGSGNVNYLNFPTTPLVLGSDFFDGGWLGATTTIQLHLDGFIAPVGTDDIVSLDAAKVNVAPNPVQDQLNLQFALTEIADKVSIGIVDVSGKVLSSYNYEHVYQNDIQIDVHELPAGVYFIGINTPEGYRSVKIVKL